MLVLSHPLESTALDFLLHVHPGVVNMHADGAVSGKCDGAQFQSDLDRCRSASSSVPHRVFFGFLQDFCSVTRNFTL